MTEGVQPPSPNPFHYQLFRVLWGGTLLANISLWMQNVGAAWLMASLTPSILMVALVQTATSLPTFLFGLPGGVLADLIDRRRLLLLVHVGMFLCAGWLAVLSFFHLLGPWTLLGLTFGLGTFSALSSTVRQASVSDVVPRIAMVSALGFSGIAYNSARAIGPALAGLILAWTGTSMVFAVNAVLFAAVLVIQFTQYTPPRTRAPSTENPIGAMRSGLRYVWNAPVLHAYLIRTTVFVSAASSLWALLPIVARNHPDFGSGGYGILLGALGIGAVASGFMLGRLRARFSFDSMATVAGYVFAAATLAAALVDQLTPLCIALVAGGAAWVLNNSTINAAFQTSLPAWVRARALSIRLLTFQGSMAIGSVIWGAVATWIGASPALIVAGILTLAGLLVTRRYPIQMGQEADFIPSRHWAEPVVSGEPLPDDGPVAIQMEYHIAASTRAEFIKAIHALGTTRRRDGARHWRLYRDLANPDHYAERFVVESWAEHGRQQKRATMADQLAEKRVRVFHIGDAAITVSHFIGESDSPRKS